jgi:hypothetical protein
VTPYFPHQTLEFRIEEPPAFRKFTMSIAEMAIVTGLLFRLYRALAMSVGPMQSWWYFGLTFAFGVLFVFGMATMHLGNFPLHRWLWRAPVFAAIEAATESLTSLALIFAHREPIGSARAQPHDWLGISASIFVWRIASVCVFALVLAGVVQFVRYALLRREHRLHTAVAVHEKQSQ